MSRSVSARATVGYTTVVVCPGHANNHAELRPSRTKDRQLSPPMKFPGPRQRLAASSAHPQGHVMVDEATKESNPSLKRRIQGTAANV